jgi:hypothetical protein
MFLLFLHLSCSGFQLLVEVDQPLSSLPIAGPKAVLLLQLMQQNLILVFQDQHSSGM